MQFSGPSLFWPEVMVKTHNYNNGFITNTQLFASYMLIDSLESCGLL